MTPLLRYYDRLLERFGLQHWWPGETPWEIACGAVLTQNTNWQNVEKAIARLDEVDALTAEAVVALPAEQLADLIRPAGYFNVKSRRLKNLATWWCMRSDWACAEATTLELRRELLQVNGVGKETADCILLYAFERPVFVIDAYTKRMLTRHRLLHEDPSYDEQQALFLGQLGEDRQLYNEYHALIVRLGKEYCGTRPRCDECPLAEYLPS